ncbi:MAG TPA: F0F1 ATP synthase subunit A [Candidatus Paceibacterota bacterium]
MVHVSIQSEHLFEIFGFPVTNTLLTGWIVIILLCIFAWVISKRIKEVPDRFQNAVEAFFEGIFNFMAGFAPNRETAKKFFPLALTIFIFVLSANWIGILPGVGSIGFTEIHEGGETFVPLFRSVYSDLNMTLALALIVVTLVHIVGVVTIGLRGHAHKFFNFSSFGNAFAGILELVSEAAKIISFSFRLFGNVFAGEVLLVIIASLVPYLAPVPFLGLELFVGFIQALIFSVLAMLFLGSATQSHAEAH